MSAPLRRCVLDIQVEFVAPMRTGSSPTGDGNLNLPDSYRERVYAAIGALDGVLRNAPEVTILGRGYGTLGHELVDAEELASAKARASR